MEECMKTSRCPNAFVARRQLFVAAAAVLFGIGVPGSVTVTGRPAAANRLSWGTPRLVFEPNVGQTAPEVRFLSRGQGYTVFLTSSGATLSLARKPGAGTATLRLELVGATGVPAVEGRDPRQGRSHYLVGRDAARGRTAVHHYGRVAYRGVYPGIDLEFYGNQRHLEYDFVVAAHADPGVIQLRFSGADTVHVEAGGDLVLALGDREVRQPAPVVFQDTPQGRRLIQGRYRLLANRAVGFELGVYDRSRRLVIDPVLAYASYLGGTGNDTARAVAVDAQGNVYVGGTTTSTDFPVEGAYQSATAGGTSDAFVTKLNAAGTDIVYSTYIGGNGADEGRGIAVDSTGSAYLVGQTQSGNFPWNSPLSSYHTSGDGFIAKLSPAGNTLAYSVQFGSNGTDAANGVALDSQANAYITGLWAGSDVFVHRLNAAATAWGYTRTLGGASSEEGYGIGANAAGSVCVTGRTWSANFPVLNPLQATLPSTYAPFVAKYDPDGTLQYATFLGGSSLDTSYGAAIDDLGRCFVAGSAFSSNFPTYNAAFPTAPGGTNAFVTAYNAAGSAYLYSTYLGGSGGESAYGIAVEPGGTAHVVGASSSTDFPAVNAIQSELKDLGAIFTSTDAAASFSRVVMPGLSVQAIAVDPTNVLTAYAGTSNGLYKTEDGGASWTVVGSNLTYRNIQALAIDPNDHCFILGGADIGRTDINSTGMLVVSTNCGATWGYLADAPLGKSVRSVAFTTAIPAAVYIGFIKNGDVFHTVGRRTVLGGVVTWEFSTPGYYPSVATDPQDPCRAYTGTQSGYVYENTSCGTPAWSQVGATLTGMINAVAPHPTTQGTLLAGSSDGIIYRKADASSPWATVATVNGSVRSIVYEPGNPAVAYAAGSGGRVYKTVNGGLTWEQAALLGPGIASLGVSADAPEVIYAAAGSPGATDAFWTRLSDAGSILDSTLVGGNGPDSAKAVALDPEGNPVLVGTTTGFNLATPGAVQPASGGAEDSFVVRIDRTPPAAPGRRSDFTGDMKSDILWHHATHGEVWLWPMDGGVHTAETYVSTVGDVDWQIRGLGDQTGDGQADILWRHATTGQLYLWTMDGGDVVGDDYVGTVDVAFDIIGTGDYNGDGRSDLLWRHAATGQLWLWEMNGPTAVSVSYVDTVDAAYAVVGSGDLDGDGKADLVWRGAAGDVWVWLMNGATRKTLGYVATVSEPEYEVAVVADYSGDGQADLLWRHATRGELWVWTMTGVTQTGVVYVDTVGDTGYRVVGYGDYDGDGQADLLWHHATRGEVWVWLMNGAEKLSEVYVGTVPDTGYRIVR
jgi:hypothetical protein